MPKFPRAQIPFVPQARDLPPFSTEGLVSCAENLAVQAIAASRAGDADAASELRLLLLRVSQELERRAQLEERT